MDTRAGGRFSDERQSRDNHQQNDKLLHSNILDGNGWNSIKLIVRGTREPAFNLLQKKKHGAQSGDDNKENQREHLGPVYGSELNRAR